MHYIRWIALLAVSALAACGLPGYPPLISGNSPAAAEASNSQPQPINSLPPYAEGLPGGPNGRHPDYLSGTFPAF
jgi:hypothetical protein